MSINSHCTGLCATVTPAGRSYMRNCPKMPCIYGTMRVAIPDAVQRVLDILTTNGYEAYVVGGCVRDSLLGRPVHDWDICTNALPQQVIDCARTAGAHVAETGLQHGTVTVILDHQPCEVTTYRVEGEYTDHRRPDSVTFVRELRDDLARRDFTINAMAYHHDRGLVDCLGGQADLAAGRIACVGDPDARFGEDALRIMRALRFASCYGFAIAPASAEALLRLRHTLGGIAVERITAELLRLLCGVGVGDILTNYLPVLGVVIPELLPMEGLDQCNPHHVYDLWQHTVHAVEAAPANSTLRLAALLHDVGKPSCMTVDDACVGHFYGHAAASETMTREILIRLRLDNRTKHDACELVQYHDATIALTRRSVRRWLGRLGEEQLLRLLDLKAADATAQATDKTPARLADIATLRQMVHAVVAEGDCIGLHNLAVNGRDLIAAGICEGVDIGRTLRELLEQVLEDRLLNEHACLLAAAASLNNNSHP